MNDARGNRLILGAHIAVAFREGNGAGIKTGTITDLDVDAQRFRMAYDNARGDESPWLNYKSLGYLNRVIIVD